MSKRETESAMKFTRTEVAKKVTDALYAWYLPPQPEVWECHSTRARARVIAELIATDLTGIEDPQAEAKATEDWQASMATNRARHGSLPVTETEDFVEFVTGTRLDVAAELAAFWDDGALPSAEPVNEEPE